MHVGGSPWTGSSRRSERILCHHVAEHSTPITQDPVNRCEHLTPVLMQELRDGIACAAETEFLPKRICSGPTSIAAAYLRSSMNPSQNDENFRISPLDACHAHELSIPERNGSELQRKPLGFAEQIGNDLERTPKINRRSMPRRPDGSRWWSACDPGVQAERRFRPRRVAHPEREQSL